ncbi:hypothetical protein BS47DRAFT_1407608 [Hydnum rufescens UP504]|uniref:Uncharacterized protein n=1 Tax=Hydnum rufescens UP504 TaxID=1448309 RepID=A0A9P6DPZ2_9AGAM|nr:hypothetical protein BS47DRAFT_1407608 [Hydnum rufescens UP504]
MPCILLLVTGILATAFPLLALVSSPHVPPPDQDFPSVQGLHHDQPEPENAMLEDQAPEAQTVSQLPGPVSSDHDHDTSMQVDARQVGLLVSPKDLPIIPSSEFDDLDIQTDDNGQPGTESNETAEASPVNLDPPIFVGDWFHIKFSSVTGDVNIREVFEHLSEDHLFSVCVWKNKGGKGLACLKKVMLAFKLQPQWDAMLSHFRNSPGSRLFDFEEATKIAVAHQESIASFRWVLDPDYVEMCYAHQQSADNLTLMLENAPACREIGNLCMLHLFPPPLEGDSGIQTFIRYHFLDLHRFPPLVADEVEYLQCTLDRVEFTTAWFLATLDQEYDVIQCHLKMINLLAFWVLLYITHGPYDVLVRELGQMAKTAVAAGDQAVLYSRPSRPCHMEAFGFLDSQVWFIEWDSSSPHPTLFLKAGTPMFSGPR